MTPQEVILVTPQDEPTGVVEKMEAHRKGLLHRAFSVFIFGADGQMLLQQRAAQKYHGAYLWTNACCSHPYWGEKTADAARRRLVEEMGIDTPLKEIFSFTYHATVENNLIEHEFDHVFAGEYAGEICMNPEEVANYAWFEMDELEQLLAQKPAMFTAWFRIAFPRVKHWWKENYSKASA